MPLACLAAVTIVSARGAFAYDIERRFCGGEAFHADLAPPPLVLGCRMAGCCPGCSADAPVDLVIDVEGDLPIRLSARIDGETAPAVDLPLGRTVMGGVGSPAACSGQGAAAACARPRLLRVEATVDAGAIEQAARATAAAPFNAGAQARLDVTFTQSQRDRVVAVDHYTATATSCPIQRPLTDRIELSGNDAGDEAVVVARGARAGACVSGEIWRGKRLIYIGNMESKEGCASDVEVFARDHAAVLRSVGGLSLPAPPSASKGGPAAAADVAATPHIVAGREVGAEGWTPAVGERLEVSLAAPRVVLPVVVRLVAAASQIQALRARAGFDLAVADRALNLARCGIAVASGAELVADPLDEAARRDLLAAGESPEQARCQRVGDALGQQGLLTPGKVAVVYLAEAATAVYACREEGLVVIGGLSQPESLAHGLGHLLALDDAESAGPSGASTQVGVALANASPGSENLMSPQAGSRRTFTLGQCFVAAFDPRSIVNRWRLRQGPIRDCGPSAVADSCPPIGFDAQAQ